MKRLMTVAGVIRSLVLVVAIGAAAQMGRATTVLSTSSLVCDRTTFGFIELCSAANADGPFGSSDYQMNYGSVHGVGFTTAAPQPIQDVESSGGTLTDIITFTSTGTATGTSTLAGAQIVFDWKFLLNLLTTTGSGAGTGSITGNYTVTYDIFKGTPGANNASPIKFDVPGNSVFGGPVSFGSFTNAPSDSGRGSAITTQTITAGQTYTTLAQLDVTWTRTGGTPALGVQGDFEAGVPEPATMGLMGAGLMLLAWPARKRLRRG